MSEKNCKGLKTAFGPEKKIYTVNQYRAPIPEAMKAYAEDGALAFHTPGHKQGLGAHPLLRELITPLGLKTEVSLMEELDDIHAPEGCIKEAQELAGELYGADGAFFMINGTTGAIHTMLLAALQPGDKVLVPRNAHRSMIGGIILAGAVPVYLQPEFDEEYGIAMGLCLETVAAAVAAHPDARALACVYPTYYGVASDLTAIAQLLHQHNMLLLVDEAHGPHLKFCDRLPRQALDCGADVVAQSTHKIIGSMTQTSVLLVRQQRISLERVAQAASLLQSTSPNYLLLASLDIARLQMAESGKALVGRAVELSEKLRQKIAQVPGLKVMGRERLRNSGSYDLDATKITVSVRGLGLSGPEAEHILRHQFKIQCELADAYNLLFIISMADTEVQCQRLLEALQGLAAAAGRSGAAVERNINEATEASCGKPDGGCEAQKDKAGGAIPIVIPPLPEQGVNPREAFFAATENIAFARAVGCLSAEQIMFYPPGIPVICPGERFTEELCRYIRNMQQLGLKVTGPADTSLATVRVIAE